MNDLMKNAIGKIIVFTLYLTLSISLYAQDEISRGFTLDLELTQGYRVDRIGGVRPYVGSIGVVPAYYMLNNRFNAGLTVMTYYTNPKFAFAAGPRLGWKCYAMKSDAGMVAEISLIGEACIGTRDLRLVGGALMFDTDLISFAIHYKRELDSKGTWIMASTGFTLDNLLGF